MIRILLFCLFLFAGCIDDSSKPNTGLDFLNTSTNYSNVYVLTNDSSMFNNLSQNDSTNLENISDFEEQVQNQILQNTTYTKNTSYVINTSDTNNTTNSFVYINDFENITTAYSDTIVDNLTIQSEPDSNSDSSSIQKIYATAIIDPLNGRYETKRCRIKLDKTAITNLQTVWVNIYSYSPSNEQTTFLCGDYEKIQGFGSLIQDEVACVYGGNGITNVWLALDGYVCASAPLWIYEEKLLDSPSICQTINYTQTQETINGSNVISSCVFVSGYNKSSILSLSCADQTFEFVLSDIMHEQDSAFIKLSCITGESLNVKEPFIYINEKYCGSLFG